MLTFGSLFAGIGGIDLGFERAGMRCVWQVEKNEYCRRVLAKHWPDVRRHDDVCTFPPEGNWSCDVIVGGDPCQRNSAVGKSTQESLAPEFLRVVNAIRPRLVLRENPSATRKDAPWPWWRFRSVLESLGYVVLPFRLRACCTGKFHQRERLFLLGCLASDANSIRLEGREEETQVWHPMQSEGRIHAGDWMALYSSRGYRSRSRIPYYVDRVRGLGNAVVPQVAERIGRILMTSIGA